MSESQSRLVATLGALLTFAGVLFVYAVFSAVSWYSSLPPEERERLRARADARLRGGDTCSLVVNGRVEATGTRAEMEALARTLETLDRAHGLTGRIGVAAYDARNIAKQALADAVTPPATPAEETP